jgi:hypothetical protein
VGEISKLLVGATAVLSGRKSGVLPRWRSGCASMLDRGECFLVGSGGYFLAMCFPVKIEVCSLVGEINVLLVRATDVLPCGSDECASLWERRCTSVWEKGERGVLPYGRE